MREMREREKERESERERERERQTDRQTDRHKQTEKAHTWKRAQRNRHMYTSKTKLSSLPVFIDYVNKTAVKWWLTLITIKWCYEQTNDRDNEMNKYKQTKEHTKCCSVSDRNQRTVLVNAMPKGLNQELRKVWWKRWFLPKFPAWCAVAYAVI